ncbi:SDR family NAD(P)-dependent oxidoreductase [Dyadobacter sandarakinus]|uniref:SDR family NAD(P)-dependent oxidoreductase n=1 Tax=Dyadobacter sandarakinus TaxID=2747268 RepID=A0ABX7IBC9_9BACT|nr:SDR family NAD(P)-dependent oxidoreductase [Dyadobacter sandarakinus]QRR03422.1 SDR family NAD(P)-dependent oxidoreductase [Dyadobacter sandarakinus]
MQKQILLTGASGNLGQAVVSKLLGLDYGLHVSLRSGRESIFAGQKNMHTYPADLTSVAEAGNFAAAAIAAAGTIHAGVFLAGGYAAGKLEDTTDEDITSMLNINFFTAFHLIKPLFEHFKASGGGQFVLVGARPAIVAEQGASSFAYALSKSLLFQTAEMINATGEEHDITATVIVPSIIDTPDNRSAMPDADFSKWIPAADMAEAIAFTLGATGSKMRQTILKLYNNA